MSVNDIILLGIQGSGKGTQARQFTADHPEYTIFGAGKALRDTDPNSDLGKEIRSFTDDGQLVPGRLILHLAENFLKGLTPDDKIILDGFPRTLEQLEGYKALEEKYGREAHCIELTLNEQTALARIESRAHKEGRADDLDHESVLHRIANFKEQTKPVIQEFINRGQYTAVSGEGSPEESYSEFEPALLEL